MKLNPHCSNILSNSLLMIRALNDHMNREVLIILTTRRKAISNPRESSNKAGKSHEGWRILALLNPNIFIRKDRKILRKMPLLGRMRGKFSF